MEIVIPPPEIGRWVLLGVPLLGVVIALLMRRQPLLVRLLPVVALSAVSAGVWRVAMRPMRFAWDAAGIRDATFGDERRIAWSDIRDARLVRGYRHSRACPVRRTNGTYYSGFAGGVWTLADGRSVRVFLEPGSEDALLVTAAGETYLWSPRSFGTFLDAVRAHARVGDAS